MSNLLPMLLRLNHDTLDRLNRSDYLVGMTGNYETSPLNDLGNRAGIVSQYDSPDTLLYPSGIIFFDRVYVKLSVARTCVTAKRAKSTFGVGV